MRNSQLGSPLVGRGETDLKAKIRSANEDEGGKWSIDEGVIV